MAGWPRGRPVWTASLPCQPFSTAGKRRGEDDERHLWPVFRVLLDECRPAICFGEQTSSPDGRRWWSSVSADLEAMGYAAACADLCAAGVGAPHIRQRLFWVAYSGGERCEGGSVHLLPGAQGQARTAPPGCGTPSRLANADRSGLQLRLFDHAELGYKPRAAPSAHGSARGMGDADRDPARRHSCSSSSQEGEGTRRWEDPWGLGNEPGSSGPAEWVWCADYTFRPTQPGIPPLAPRVPSTSGRLRASGNAIVPQVGAVFIRSVMDLLGIELEFPAAAGKRPGCGNVGDEAGVRGRPPVR
ncbi:MAG: DNA cytosine methyltransferase [Myxococcota bacterium]